MKEYFFGGLIILFVIMAGMWVSEKIADKNLKLKDADKRNYRGK